LSPASQHSISSGFSPARSIAINGTGAIYVVGGPDGASEGEPHLTTIDGVRYDFQSAGEFVLFHHTGDIEGQASGAKIDDPDSRRNTVEIQVRQFPVATTWNTCVSFNAAVAARVGEHKVTYEPNLNGQPDPSGLQLRIDRKLIALDPSGMRLGNGGRIVPTSTPGGLEVDFPDDTVMFVTPAWWAWLSKWYLNVNVEPGRRARGLVGDVPNGSWVPALPDGTSMGPKPTSAHDQYVALYERFADAWRVTDKTSLFDYAPGTSTDTFTMRGWPPENGKCDIPGAVPPEGASEEVAKEACKVVPGDPANCIFDVKVTGLINIANTYVASRNAQPVQETGPKCNCQNPSPSGGGGIAVFTLAALLATWALAGVWRRKRTVST
jgi:lysyl endopeptidase